MFVELKKVDPNIISNIKASKIFESNATIFPDKTKELVGLYDSNTVNTEYEYMTKKDSLSLSDIAACTQVSAPSAEQGNKIQLSEEEMIHIYYDIIGKCYVYRCSKINDVLHNLKNAKLKEKLEFILNSNMDILRSFKYSDDNIVNEISKALNGFAVISDIYIRNIIIFIIRNLYNKYIYSNKLPSIIDICIKYQNKIQDETIDNAIFSYIFDRKPASFFDKIIYDYYNKDD